MFIKALAIKPALADLTGTMLKVGELKEERDIGVKEGDGSRRGEGKLGFEGCYMMSLS